MISDRLMRVVETLGYIQEDMFLCDKEKSLTACKYTFIRNPSDYSRSVKHLIETLNYRRVYWKDVYLGIACKSDPRFDKKGQIIDV